MKTFETKKVFSFYFVNLEKFPVQSYVTLLNRKIKVGGKSEIFDEEGENVDGFN
jgi:hypothetical protein